MKIFISIISHGHDAMLINSVALKDLCDKFIVIIKKNDKENSLYGDVLKRFCRDNKAIYINEYPGLGFGQNNNFNFDYCCSELNLRDEDLFFIVNPDVVIDSNTISDIANYICVNKIKLATINLFRDFKFQDRDPSIRFFPSLLTFAKSFIGLGNNSIYPYKRNGIYDVDWAAGSLLIFNAGFYKELAGFDEGYFMYCEDIDICYRAKKNGIKVKYLAQFQAVHLGRHRSHKLTSRHFYWHFYSALRFVLRKHFSFIKSKRNYLYCKK
ncbi:glycosyltransferase family 2 protein [Yersinia alsatica]|uniref:glycosyltransferase family 2 protein n=1 Tax=Yersinia alsatica TaxID=2890317 RepID=UPI000B6BE09F|nr:glycosyltransferase [Yersinia alsatica]OVZ95490.1 hypothetical protein CBW58_00085 [Yersinia frederiksenii]